jgi:hypothetical protein
VSGATCIDPLTEARLRGNPELVDSALSNFDLRGEWFLRNGNNFTASLFYQDMSNPIETIDGAGTDDNVSLTFINGDEAQVYGVEFERLANLQIGYYAPGDAHSATLVYSVSGERIFFAGRNGAEDACEQPFNSLDLSYRVCGASGHRRPSGGGRSRRGVRRTGIRVNISAPVSRRGAPDEDCARKGGLDPLYPDRQRGHGARLVLGRPSAGLPARLREHHSGPRECARGQGDRRQAVGDGRAGRGLR